MRSLQIVFLCPPTPRPAHIDDGSGRFNGIKRLESFTENSGLLIPAAGLTQRMAEWPTQEDRSRWFDFFGIGTVEGDADRGDAAAFYFTLDQSHGLMADPSGRCQQYRIHLHILEHASDLGRGPTNQCADMVPGDMAHE